jgi:hypothetical protein
MIHITVEINGRKEFRKISNSQFNWLKRNGKVFRDENNNESISKHDYDTLPYMREMPEGTNTMRISFTPAQMAKIKYGRTLRVYPSQTDTKDGFIIRHLTDANIQKLIQSKRTKRRTKLVLTDAEIQGSWAKV